jgi:hypothetical protein
MYTAGRMETFGVLLIAVDKYPDPPGPLPSSDSAGRFAGLLTGDHGGTVIESIVASSEEDITAAFERWVGSGSQGPLSTIVYLVGHGTDDGDEHTFLVPGPAGTRDVVTGSFARFLHKDWFRRQADRGSWMLFVLDCCGADIGVTNLTTALTSQAHKRPRRLALWPATPSGASHSGSFVTAFARALSTFTENDAVIPLNELFDRMSRELGGLEADGRLPSEAALQNPLHSPSPLVMNLDARAELQRVIAGLPDDVRNHFLAKAQGAEAGDPAWYFSGRQAQIGELSAWLRDSPSGMRIVTGEAGSGKSALLGHVLVLSNERLTEAYRKSGLAEALDTDTRPPAGVFDATLHLTGRTLAQTLADLRNQIAAQEVSLSDAISPDSVVHLLKASGRRMTVLADALDEAQEPMAIADSLRQFVAADVARVVVGTRRSLGEGVDQEVHPERRELIDALGPGADDVIVIERDNTAVRDYVVRRLSASASPYVNDPLLIEGFAERIAAAGQPMLFARLVTSELLARPPLTPSDAEFVDLISGGHRRVFEGALHRLTRDSPAIVMMLRALALSRGRGVPETGGTWLAMGRTFRPGIPDTAVRETLDRAAPYILLDAEGGQSVYRLAHRTFIESFPARRAREGAEHLAIGYEIAEVVEHKGGWAVANYYPVRYLAEHLAGGDDREFGDVDRLVAFVTDAGWLARAVAMLGVDDVVDTLGSARRKRHLPIVHTIERVLRRARIALGRDPAQLAAQVHARLHKEDDPRLAMLGERLAQETDTPWLRMRRGWLDWQADVETTYGLVGRIRALAFGEIDDQPLIAIGIDDVIRLWDPRRSSDRVLENDRRRPTALALSHLDGRPVVVAAASYDGIAVIRDLRSGAQIGPALELGAYVDTIAAGRLGDRLAVAATGRGSLFVWDIRSGKPFQPASSIVSAAVRGVAVYQRRLVVFVVREVGTGIGVWVVDLATGQEIWGEPQIFDSSPEMITATEFGEPSTLLAAASFVSSSPGIVSWMTAQPVAMREGLDGPPARALTVGAVQGFPIIASAPDYPSTALVAIRLPDLFERSFHRLPDVRLPAFARTEAVFVPDGGNEAPFAQLHDQPFGTASLDFGAPPPALDAETVSFALTGVRRSDLNFAGNPPKALVEPRSTRQSGSVDERHRIDRPATWPRTARAYGLVQDRAAIAIGSIGGSVWVWELGSDALIAGPLVSVPERVEIRGWSRRDLTMKGAPGHTSSVALGQHPVHGDVVAVAYEGKVRLVSLPAGEAIPTPAEEATVVTAVALGRLLGEEMLVTGSQGGVIVVWSLASNARIAALTIDSGVEKVWVVRGADAIAVQTTTKGGRTLFVLDVVAS